jgi:AcrR family transcriptional regulator
MRPDRTLDLILEAATRVFTQLGRAASMQDVAAEAGVGRATLYRYARSRDDLVEALQRRAIQHVAAQMEAADFDSVDPAAALERLVRAVLAAQEGFEFLSTEAMQLDEAEVHATLGAPVIGVLTRCRDAGLLRDDPLEFQARALGALCHAAGVAARQDRTPRDWAGLVLTTFVSGAGTSPL